MISHSEINYGEAISLQTEKPDIIELFTYIINEVEFFSIDEYLYDRKDKYLVRRLGQMAIAVNLGENSHTVNYQDDTLHGSSENIYVIIFKTISAYLNMDELKL